MNDYLENSTNLLFIIHSRQTRGILMAYCESIPCERGIILTLKDNIIEVYEHSHQMNKPFANIRFGNLTLGDQDLVIYCRAQKGVLKIKSSSKWNLYKKSMY